MKKIISTLSMLLFATTFTSAFASNHCKKHQKCSQKCMTYCKTKHKKHYASATTTMDANNHPVTNNEEHDVSQQIPGHNEQEYDFFSGLSGTMALTTNYVFRGISQTSNLPAVQGGLTYTFPMGIYVNAWSSNVKFTNSTATVELDTILGLHRTVGEDFIYDINIARYNYPGASVIAYNEANSIFNYKFLQFGLSYSSNAYNSGASGTYGEGGINYKIPQKYAFNLQDVGIIALIGRYKLGSAAGNSYTAYNVTLNKKLSDIYTIAIQWASTNGQSQQRPYDRDLVLGSVTANF